MSATSVLWPPRLQCPHAGLFQCRLTGLVFLMEGEGEVLYRTVQWDDSLLHSTGRTPAGPLFSIECPRGSVRQLHLPHCEISSGEFCTTSSSKFSICPNANIMSTSVQIDNCNTHIIIGIRAESLKTSTGYMVRKQITLDRITQILLITHSLRCYSYRGKYEKVDELIN